MSHSPPLQVGLGFVHLSLLKKTFCSFPFLRGAARAGTFRMPFLGRGQFGGSLRIFPLLNSAPSRLSGADSKSQYQRCNCSPLLWRPDLLISPNVRKQLDGALEAFMMTEGGIKPGALSPPPTTSLHPHPFPSNSSLLNSWGPRLPAHPQQQQQSVGVRGAGGGRGASSREEAGGAQKVLTSSEEEETARAGPCPGWLAGRLPGTGGGAGPGSKVAGRWAGLKLRGRCLGCGQLNRAGQRFQPFSPRGTQKLTRCGTPKVYLF